MRKGFTSKSALCGLRVEIPCHYDAWMMGARYGTISSVQIHNPTNQVLVTVKMDHPSVEPQTMELADGKILEISPWAGYGQKTNVLHFSRLVDSFAYGNCQLKVGARLGDITITEINTHTVQYKQGAYSSFVQLAWLDSYGNLTRAGELANLGAAGG